MTCKGVVAWGAPCATWTLVCAAAVAMAVLMQCIELRIAVVDGRGSVATGVYAQTVTSAELGCVSMPVAHPCKCFSLPAHFCGTLWQLCLLASVV